MVRRLVCRIRRRGLPPTLIQATSLGQTRLVTLRYPVEARNLVEEYVFRGTVLRTPDSSYYARMSVLGVSRADAVELYQIFRWNPDLCQEEEITYLFIKCEVTKYFEVKVRSKSKTPQVRFELRTDLTIPSKYVTQQSNETKEEWENRLQEYLNKKVEPIFDKAFDDWGNNERIVRNPLTGKSERLFNVLHLGDFTPQLNVKGVEVFEETRTFNGSLEIQLAKYDDTGFVMMTDKIRMNVSESTMT